MNNLCNDFNLKVVGNVVSNMVVGMGEFIKNFKQIRTTMKNIDKDDYLYLLLGSDGYTVFYLQDEI